METSETTNLQNKKHIKKIYTDKATNLLKICIGIFIFSGLSYIVGIFLYESFDFGLIFEIISSIFVLIAINKIEQNNLPLGKKFTILAMIPVGWLIIYDFIYLFINIDEVISEVIGYYISFKQYFYYLAPYLFDVTLVTCLMLLYGTYSSLCKADCNKKDGNYIDTFYDKL